MISNYSCLHFRRIHRRVARRILLDLPQRTRDIIAMDSGHESDEYKWFEKKAFEDAKSLFEDPKYYDNQPETFRYSEYEPLPVAA